MSDSESLDVNQRQRRRRNRERPNGRGDGKRWNSQERALPIKPPIILAKPDQVSTGDWQADFSHTVLAKKDGKDSPVFVGNTKELFQAEPRDLPTPTPVYHIQQKQLTTSQVADTLHTKLSPPKDVATVKIVDEHFHWIDAGLDSLLDQSDFFVIGVVGMQGVGKSTLLSFLAGTSVTAPEREYIFLPESKDTQELAQHQTTGIDMHVTSERIIFLDTQPMFSPSVLDALIRLEKKYPSEFATTEDCIQMQSLQLASFLLAVCNVVLVVQDWFADTGILRLLQTAEMLKPSMPPPSSQDLPPHDDQPEYYPHLVFVQNRAGHDDFTVRSYNRKSSILANTFAHSKYKCRGAVTLANGLIVGNLNAETVPSNVNLYVLPMLDESSAETVSPPPPPPYRGHPSFAHLIRWLRNQLFSMPRSLQTHTVLSEKNWYHYAAKTWDVVRKSTLASEYNRMLP